VVGVVWCGVERERWVVSLAVKEKTSHGMGPASRPCQKYAVTSSSSFTSSPSSHDAALGVTLWDVVDARGGSLEGVSDTIAGPPLSLSSSDVATTCHSLHRNT
jgi:hypothetical protein